jgi:hypothetical protein
MGHVTSNLEEVKHIKPYLFSLPLTWVAISTCSKEREVLNYTSTCMLNVEHLCSYTLWFSGEHLCSEQEIPLHISFAYCCSLKFEASILCTNTCFIQSSNKLQIPCLVLAPSLIWARRRRWSPISGLHQDERSSLLIGTPGRPTICNN